MFFEWWGRFTQIPLPSEMTAALNELTCDLVQFGADSCVGEGCVCFPIN